MSVDVIGPRASRASDLAFGLVYVAIPLLLFRACFHLEVLLPSNISWLMQGDWGAHLVGWNAFRHDFWRWPLGSTRLLAWPTGVTTTFTDSNPLVSLILKPFSAVLPARFQFTGIWFLACVGLHFSIAYALLRPDARSRWLGLAGATLLTLVPALINRIGHSTLFAHWTILLSLYVFIRVAREDRRDLFYGVVLVVSALLHPYLLLMNASIWGSDMLRRGVLLARSDPAGIPGLALRSAMVAAGVVAAFLAVGGAPRDNETIGGFGYYSMSLDALFNSGRDDYSLLFDPWPQGAGQVFEGFQYLGAGLLLLLAAAGVALVSSSAARDQLRRMTWLLWLAPAMAVLSALALSDSIQLHGREVAHISYSWIPFGLTDVFRASGRLFWPCTYAAIVAALQVIFALRPGRALAICIAALVLQVVDVSGLAASARALTAPARNAAVYVRTPDPRWNALVASSRLVAFQPPNPHQDERLFYEMAWRASSLRRPVNVMYTARPNRKQHDIESGGRRDFLAGILHPDRLYILSDLCLPPAVDPAAVRVLDGVFVIPPAGFTLPLPQAPKSAPIAFGQTLRFAPGPGDEAGRCALGLDWSDREGWGVWSKGPDPELALRLARRPDRDLVATFVAHGFPPSGQSVSVQVGGRTVGRLAPGAEGAPTSVTIPRDAIPGDLLRLVLHVDHPQSPKALGLSPDERLLGVGLESMRLDQAAPG